MGKFIIIVLVVAYVLSPVDLMPGFPLDDIIIAMIGWVAIQKKNNRIASRN